MIFAVNQKAKTAKIICEELDLYYGFSNEDLRQAIFDDDQANLLSDLYTFPAYELKIEATCFDGWRINETTTVGEFLG